MFNYDKYLTDLLIITLCVDINYIIEHISIWPISTFDLNLNKETLNGSSLLLIKDFMSCGEQAQVCLIRDIQLYSLVMFDMSSNRLCSRVLYI